MKKIITAMLIIVLLTFRSTPFADSWLVALAEESSCPPSPNVDPNLVPFSFGYDANDVLLPLFPGDPTRWTLPRGPWTRPVAKACEPDGQQMSVVCMWYEINGEEVLDRSQWPEPNYDPNTATWAPSVVVKRGISKAVFRAFDNDPNEPEYDDFTLTWKSKNRKPRLH